MMGVHGLPNQATGGIPRFNRPAPVVTPRPNPNPSGAPNGAVNYYGDFGGCGWWRMHMPETMINYSKLGMITGMHKLIPDPNFYKDVKCVRLQRQASPVHAEFFKNLRKASDDMGFKLVYEIDDIVFKDDIPDFNKAKSAFDSDETLNSILSMMNDCHELTVTCDYMKNYYAEKLDHDNIRVIPNMPSKIWFDGYYSSTKVMTDYNTFKNRPRILYAGSGNHFDIEGKGRDDDFTHVIDAIIKSRKNLKWVFQGSIPNQLMPFVKSGEMEFHKWAFVPNYPKAIYDLKINAVVAPLMDCTFNKAKSNIKYLEAACLGIPGVFQDLVTYKDAPIRFSDGADMIKKLTKLLENRQYYAKMSKLARNYADSMWLDDHIDMYTDMYFGG